VNLTVLFLKPNLFGWNDLSREEIGLTRPFEKERIQVAISRALLSVSQVRLSVSIAAAVIFHWQPVLC